MAAPLTQRSTERASVLLVDDRPEKLIALEAVLADLDVDLVKAESGREALRWVLQREFAAILLDVNMPMMDGFETAMLIRKRKASERTPIIFVTAYSEDMHVARGYSLGAVDFIVAPIVPDVMRTKVSVFVDLFNAVRQQRRHAEALERHAVRLQRLTRASQAINSGGSTDEIVDAAMLAARDIVGGGSVAIGLMLGENRVRTRELPAAGGAARECGNAVRELLQSSAASAGRVGGHVERIVVPRGTAATDGRSGGEPALGVECLLASLVGREGRQLGVIGVGADDAPARFDRDDEALFLQLAQMTGIAIENLLFSQEHEANKLKEEFLSTLSHELRTPLTAILGWVRLLQQGRLDGSASERALEVIERNVKVQSKLIDDLLDISRIAAGKLRLSVQPVLLHELLLTAVEAARPMAEAKGLVLETVLANEVDPIAGDPDRLQQVVWNLLTNAIKFTPQGGRIEVRLGSNQSHVVIEVRDTGKGIPRDFLPHVFERFRQADSGSTRMHGGLGIGLAVVRHIVELHGGSVRADSAGENRGATFTVMLPSVAATGVAPVARRAADGARRVVALRRQLEGLCVLVVDDDSDTRFLLQETLVREGMRVLSASSAQEASGMLSAHPPDVIVCDIAMPVQDGWSFLSYVRAGSGASIPAIAVSAYAGDAERARSRAAGFDVHLAKPVELDELTGVIAELTARRRRAGDVSGAGERSPLAAGPGTADAGVRDPQPS
jgi:signal transduction histidine kinase/DNA-binding response OmpR family regulator